MTTNYHTAISAGAAANASTFNGPMGQLDAGITGLDGRLDTAETNITTLDGRVDALEGGSAVGNDTLEEWTDGEDYQVTGATYDTDGVLQSGTVVWPDGSPGALTRTTKNSTWLAVDAYTITHTASGKTITQAAVTRNGDGNITVKPALTIS